jgi:predicted dehydrogenase
MKNYRVGVIGFAHMHVNELVDRFIASNRATIVACADTTPATPSTITVEGSRNANLARTLAGPHAPRLYPDHHTLLATESLDIAIICPENARHADIAEACAAAGAHILTEKPLAPTIADANRIAAGKTTVVTNWPTTWRPAIRHTKTLIEAGAIGDITAFKWRNSASLGPLAHGSTHPGNTTISGDVSPTEKAAEWWHQSSAGGGALLDYCCYGAHLAAWFLPGAPQTITGLAANLLSPGDAEDNATILIRFPTTLATIEASWTTFHNGAPNGPILIGTHGTIVVDGAQILIYRERGNPTPTSIETGPPLPPGRTTIAEEMLHHLETGEPLHPTLALPLNLQTTAILDAGARAAASGVGQVLRQ